MKLTILFGTAAVAACILGAGPAMAAMAACDVAERYDDPDERIRLYTICMDNASHGQIAGALNNRAIAHLEKGDFDQAERDLNEALRYEDKFGLTYFNRAVIYAHHGQLEAALEDLNKAIDDGPFRTRHPAYLRRAIVLSAMGDYAGALADVDEVIDRPRPILDPDRRARERLRDEAYFTKAYILATAEDPAVRDGARAVAMAQDALDRLDISFGHAALAAAHAETGDFAAALQEQARAMEMASAEGVADDGSFAMQLAAYEAMMPYREASEQQFAWSGEMMRIYRMNMHFYHYGRLDPPPSGWGL